MDSSFLDRKVGDQVVPAKPKLVVLDDYEGQLASATAMDRLRQSADVTILDRALSSSDDGLLRSASLLVALRERTQMDCHFFRRCSQLELVLQTGGHAYHLDQQAATKQGIVVALGRGRTTQPPIVVPELVLGLMLGLVRQIYSLHAELVAGGWPESIGGALNGRTLGILGYGRHGRPVARLAEAFGMNVVAWDRSSDGVDDASARKELVDEFGVRRISLAELLGKADVVSIHLRLSEESRGLINRARLSQMKPNAILINTSRGAIVDEAALVEALQNKTIAGAGLDVFAVEPLPDTSPLRNLANVLLTPHVGWKVRDVLHEFVGIAADQLEHWLAGTLSSSEVLNPDAMSVHKDRLGNLLM